MCHGEKISHSVWRTKPRNNNSVPYLFLIQTNILDISSLWTRFMRIALKWQKAHHGTAQRKRNTRTRSSIQSRSALALSVLFRVLVLRPYSFRARVLHEHWTKTIASASFLLLSAYVLLKKIFLFFHHKRPTALSFKGDNHFQSHHSYARAY